MWYQDLNFDESCCSSNLLLEIGTSYMALPETFAGCQKFVFRILYVITELIELFTGYRRYPVSQGNWQLVFYLFKGGLNINKQKYELLVSDYTFIIYL